MKQLCKGPGIFKKNKFSEWLLKQVAIHLSFRFHKICLKCWNHRIGPTCCTCFLILVFSWNILYTFEITMPQLSFYMNNYIDYVVYVLLLEIVSRWNVTLENICKKNSKFVLVPGWSSQHFRYILLDPKLLLMASFFQ